jgi:hypothetical protein
VCVCVCTLYQVHDVQLDKVLAALTPQERDDMIRTKQLEEAVRPMCEEAAASAMRAERKVTPSMRILAAELGFQLHGLDFRVKSALSMGRKAVSRLSAAGKTVADKAAIEAEVWCEQRQALRYTVVIEHHSYTTTVRKLLHEFGERFSFDQVCACPFVTVPSPRPHVNCRLSVCLSVSGVLLQLLAGRGAVQRCAGAPLVIGAGVMALRCLPHR